MWSSIARGARGGRARRAARDRAPPDRTPTSRSASPSAAASTPPRARRHARVGAGRADLVVHGRRRQDDWEIVGARQTAEEFGTEHHEFLFDPSTIPTELPRLVWLTEDCGGREEAMLQMQCCASRATQTGVVFGGPRRRRAVRRHAAAPAGWPRRAAADVQRPRFTSCFSSRRRSVAALDLLGPRAAGGGLRPHPAAGASCAGRAGAGSVLEPEVNEFIRATIQRMHSFNYLEPQHEAAGAAFHSPFLDPGHDRDQPHGARLAQVGLAASEVGAAAKRRRTCCRTSIRYRRKAIQRLDVQGAMGAVLRTWPASGWWTARSRTSAADGAAAPGDPARQQARAGEPGGGPPALVGAVAGVLGAALPRARRRRASSVDPADRPDPNAPQRALRLAEPQLPGRLPLARSPPSFTTTSTT